MKRPIILTAAVLITFAGGMLAGSQLFPREVTSTPPPAACVRPEITPDNLLIAVNEYRLSKGLPQLSVEQSLVEYATLRSAELSARGQVHQSQYGDYFHWLGKTTGYRGVTELLTVSVETSCQTIDRFKESPTHNAALLDPENRYIGISLNNKYVTLEVGK